MQLLLALVPREVDRTSCGRTICGITYKQFVGHVILVDVSLQLKIPPESKLRHTRRKEDART